MRLDGWRQRDGYIEVNGEKEKNSHTRTGSRPGLLYEPNRLQIVPNKQLWNLETGFIKLKGNMAKP